MTLGLLGAALTEFIGIHAIFGAFLVGVALGDSTHLQERTRVMIDEFISFIFAPLFFASIGLKRQLHHALRPAARGVRADVGLPGKALGWRSGRSLGWFPAA